MAKVKCSFSLAHSTLSAATKPAQAPPTHRDATISLVSQQWGLPY
jgi:hypothetical protein